MRAILLGLLDGVGVAARGRYGGGMAGLGGGWEWQYLPLHGSFVDVGTWLDVAPVLASLAPKMPEVGRHRCGEAGGKLVEGGRNPVVAAVAAVPWLLPGCCYAAGASGVVGGAWWHGSEPRLAFVTQLLDSLLTSDSSLRDNVDLHYAHVMLCVAGEAA